MHDPGLLTLPLSVSTGPGPGRALGGQRLGRAPGGRFDLSRGSAHVSELFVGRPRTARISSGGSSGGPSRISSCLQVVLQTG